MITSENLSSVIKPLSAVNPNSEMASSSEETLTDVNNYATTISAASETSTSSENNDAVTLIPWELIQKGGHFEKLDASFSKLKALNMQKIPVYRQDQIKVVIHNITQITEEDLENGRTLGASALDEDVNEKM